MVILTVFSNWRNDPVLQLFVLTDEKPENAWQSQPALLKWNWPEKTIVTVRAATNCDEVELFLNNHSLGRKTISDSLYSKDWSVNYKSGEIKAIGYKNGKQVATSNLRTTDVASKVQITSLPLPIASDILLFEITTTDKNGLTVIDAKTSITVKVEGGGKLIGLDSGELNYSGSFKTNTRNTYQGRLLVSVERISSTAEDEIHIIATAPGLSTAILRVK